MESSFLTPILRAYSTFSIAAGAHTTLFIATPNTKLSERERYPEVDSVEECIVCEKADEDEGATLLECEKVCLLSCPGFVDESTKFPRSV